MLVRGLPANTKTDIILVNFIRGVMVLISMAVEKGFQAR